MWVATDYALCVACGRSCESDMLVLGKVCDGKIIAAHDWSRRKSFLSGLHPETGMPLRAGEPVPACGFDTQDCRSYEASENDCGGSDADVFDFAQRVVGDGVEQSRCIVFTDDSDSSVAYSCDDDIDSSDADSIDSSDSTSAPCAVRTFREALQYLDNPMLRVYARESSCDFSDDEDADML